MGGRPLGRNRVWSDTGNGPVKRIAAVLELLLEAVEAVEAAS